MVRLWAQLSEEEKAKVVDALRLDTRTKKIYLGQKTDGGLKMEPFWTSYKIYGNLTQFQSYEEIQ